MEDVASIEVLRRGRRQINVFESVTDKPLEPMAGFHSTVVMNYIAADHIYCAYPNLTFNYLNMINMKAATNTRTLPFAKAILKYVDRGTCMDEWELWRQQEYGIATAEARKFRSIDDGCGVRLQLHNTPMQKVKIDRLSAYPRNLVWSIELD
ncbi:hypothetical protein C0992_010023 [Termitomyces sp. T32_za158]|nr:hypothetical protein C0992_010023 [Termitomyces sp. T32_za158]